MRIFEAVEADALVRPTDDPVPDFWAITHVAQWGMVLLADAKSGEVRCFAEKSRRVLDAPLYRFLNTNCTRSSAIAGRAKAALVLRTKSPDGEDVLLLGGGFAESDRWTNCVLSLGGSLESGWKELSRRRFSGERSSAIALCPFNTGDRELCVCCVEGERNAYLLRVPLLESLAALPLPESVIFAALDGDLLAASFADHSLRLFRLDAREEESSSHTVSASLVQLSVVEQLLVQYRILWRDGFLLIGVRDWSVVRDDVVCFSLECAAAAVADGEVEAEADVLPGGPVDPLVPAPTTHVSQQKSVRLVLRRELLETGLRLLIDCWCTCGERVLAWDWNRKEMVAIALL